MDDTIVKNFYFDGWLGRGDQDTPSYKYSIEVNCLEDDLLNCLYENESKKKELEMKYGILDSEGDYNQDGTSNLGYSTYEISRKNAKIVWDELLKIIQPIVKPGTRVLMQFLQ